MVAGNTAAEIAEAEKKVGRKATAKDFETATWLTKMMASLFSAEDAINALRGLQAETRRLTQHYEGFETVVYGISLYDNEANIGIRQTTWSDTYELFVWTEIDEEGTWWFCVPVYGFETAKAAWTAPFEVDSSDPGNGGCGELGWVAMEQMND